MHKSTPKTPKNRTFSQFRFLDATRVHDKVILRRFIDWTALPRTMRGLKTHLEFGRHFGVSIDTLTDWKKLDGFWNEVSFLQGQHFRKYTSDVYYALVKKAIKEGGAREVELFHKLFESPHETSKRVETPNELAPEDQLAINKALSNIGLASLLEDE